MFGNRAQMQSMMKKARKMQEEMKKLQDKIKQKTVDVTVGGGAVSVIMNGDKQITSLTISKDAIDPNDAEMLEDLIATAVNEASRKVDDMVSENMSKVTGGLGLPGGLF
ncbi:YbaB/EbfC family nucleoid-associated protein [Dialister pneumosintes]|uniref:Nucleoid-associated protein DX915_05200 n=1 Tax=Dialister pneumosintes TaxID=39950 RepID=A0ABX9MDE3_9FIRM|nr:YbaB/EbfC family nucleoid-associated protein [Dialister pneumosintes]RID94872.1 YbaB/EbfC family nucleoid-associated protein [Dialister pneumosintes]